MFGFNKIFWGSIGYLFTAAVFLFTQNKIPQLSALRAQFPNGIYVAFGLDLLVLYLTFRPILYLSLALLIPLALWIIHASVRSRSIKNKISNKMEQIGAPVYANTPMGCALSFLGFETKDYDEWLINFIRHTNRSLFTYDTNVIISNTKRAIQSLQSIETACHV